MKSTLIIVLFLLVLPGNALFCKGFRGYCDMLWNYRLWWIRAAPYWLLLPVSNINLKGILVQEKAYSMLNNWRHKSALNELLIYHNFPFFPYRIHKLWFFLSHHVQHLLIKFFYELFRYYILINTIPFFCIPFSIP